jgi:hypothetical protein
MLFFVLHHLFYALCKVLDAIVGGAIFGIVKKAKKLMLMKNASVEYFGNMRVPHPRNKVLFYIWGDVYGDIVQNHE